jgi:hypothetical protein
MVMRMRVEKALPLVTSAVFALMVLVAALPFWLNRSMAAVLRELHGDLHVQQRMVDVLGELRDAQAAQRGFIVTGNEAFLLPYLPPASGCRRYCARAGTTRVPKTSAPSSGGSNSWSGWNWPTWTKPSLCAEPAGRPLRRRR